MTLNATERDDPGAADLPVGHALPRDISAGEAVEAEIDKFIAVRHERRVLKEGERAEEEAWKRSVRRYTVARREEMDRERYEYHRGHAERLRAALGSLIAHHEAEAEKYLPKRA